MEDADPENVSGASDDDSDSASEDDSDSGSDSDDGDEDVAMPDESATAKIMKLERRLESDPGDYGAHVQLCASLREWPSHRRRLRDARRSRSGSRSTRRSGASGSRTRCERRRGGGSAGARWWAPSSNAPSPIISPSPCGSDTRSSPSTKGGTFPRADPCTSARWSSPDSTLSTGTRSGPRTEPSSSPSSSSTRRTTNPPSRSRRRCARLAGSSRCPTPS